MGFLCKEKQHMKQCVSTESKLYKVKRKRKTIWFTVSVSLVTLVSGRMLLKLGSVCFNLLSQFEKTSGRIS